MKKLMLSFLMVVCVQSAYAEDGAKKILLNEVQVQNGKKQPIDEQKLINSTKNSYLAKLGIGSALGMAMSVYNYQVIKSAENCCVNSFYHEKSFYAPVYSTQFYFSLLKGAIGGTALISTLALYKGIKIILQRRKEKNYDKKRFISLKENREGFGLFFSFMLTQVGIEMLLDSFDSNQKNETVGATALLGFVSLLYTASILLAIKCTFDFDEKKKEELI